MVTADGAKIYSDIANSTEELKIRFKHWLQDVGLGTAIINVAKAGAYSYTFGVPNRFLPVAEGYLKELGYKVTMKADMDDRDFLTSYVTIDWRD